MYQVLWIFWLLGFPAGRENFSIESGGRRGSCSRKPCNLFLEAQNEARAKFNASTDVHKIQIGCMISFYSKPCVFTTSSTMLFFHCRSMQVNSFVE
jgi:hypothetical protein